MVMSPEETRGLCFGIGGSVWEQAKALKEEFAAWRLSEESFSPRLFACWIFKWSNPAAVIEVETTLSPRQKRSRSMHFAFPNFESPNQSLQPTGLLARG